MKAKIQPILSAGSSRLFGASVLMSAIAGSLAAITPAQAADVLIICATEGQTCNAPNARTAISYGKNGAIVTVVGVTQIGCDVRNFKVDPLQGQVKSCTYTVDPDTLSWTDCAREGSTCNFTGAKLVRYGASKWVYGSFANGVECNVGTFGDPDYGVNKRCQVAN
jgi:hypothetical protein